MTPEGFPSGGDPTRASDAEREEVARQLAEHLEDGRLSIDEHSARLDEAYAARTRGDLHGVLRDLPVLVPPPAKPPLAARLGQPARLVMGLAAPVAIAAGIWAGAGHHGGFWPVWVFIVTLPFWMRRLGRGYHRRGPMDQLGPPRS
ncbi:MAG: DUF1707 SHOCT-like domain-containing protein [Acidimicrobiales bacterium]